MSVRIAVVLVLAGGCYESHSVVGAGVGGDEDAGAPVCGACTGDPGERVHFRTTRDRSPVRWDASLGCIRATFDPALSTRSDLDMERHFRSIGEVSCSTLCFEPPVAADAPNVAVVPRASERRVHVAVVDGLEAASLVTLFQDECTAQIYYALIELDRASLDRLSSNDMARLVARSTGLFRPESARADSMLNSAPAPTRDDIQALCAMYGEPPYCD
jgi:hypothetical protein